MSDAPRPPSDTPADPSADTSAWARGVIDRHVAVEEQLAQAGLRLALAIEQGATQAAAQGQPVDKDAAMAFSRVSRAVRMTGLLQAKLIRDLDQALAKARADADAAAEEAACFEPAYRHKFRVERVVERLIKAEHRRESVIDRLCVEAGERLDDEDLYGEVLARPMGELVSLLCRDLGLKPDWSRLSEESWAREEIASGVEGSPFKGLRPTRPPPLAGEGGPEGFAGAYGFPPPVDRVSQRPHSWSG